MNSEQPSWDKIAAFLAGEMSSEEKHAFESWVSASKENEIYFQEVKAVWKNSNVKLQLHEVETESEWQRLQNRMISSRSLFGGNVWMKIAAAFFMVALAIYGLIIFNLEDDLRISSGDEVMTIYLPDSSRVWLNINSTLTYAQDFGEDDRIVTLQGEAYFDVRHDDGKKFRVNTNYSSVEVIGTSFNMKEDSSTVTLSVEKGKVIFSPAGKKGQEVSTNERITVSNGMLSEKQQASSDDVAWRKMRNPRYEVEKSQATKFLPIKYSWRKNAINQSVVEGSILNTASLAAYSNIVLDITYSNLHGKEKTVQLKIDNSVHAGERITFTKRLFDIFKDTQHMEVKVASAEISE